MRTLYLLITVILSVIVLIISFANWLPTPVIFFFRSMSMPLTIPFLFVAILGVVIGGSFVMYYQGGKNEEDEEGDGDASESDEF